MRTMSAADEAERTVKVLRTTNKAQTNHYWATITDLGFDQLAERLSPLMHYRDGRQLGTGLARFNFADVLTSKEFVEFVRHYLARTGEPA